MEYREQEWKRAGKKLRVQQVWRPFAAISPYVVKAVIIAEDDKFWHHDGFDFAAMHKAMDRNIQKGRFKYGGSTISQQLAKNLYLTPSRNPVRKLKEAVITWRIENKLSKRRILELYLNVAEWGEGIFGIEAAARHYFHKSASDLGPAEAARLVAVLPNPRRYNAVGTSRYVEARSDKIYDIMVRRGIVIENLEEVLKGQPDETPAQPSAEPPAVTPPTPQESSDTVPNEKEEKQN